MRVVGHGSQDCDALRGDLTWVLLAKGGSRVQRHVETYLGFLDNVQYWTDSVINPTASACSRQSADRVRPAGPGRTLPDVDVQLSRLEHGTRSAPTLVRLKNTLVASGCSPDRDSMPHERDLAASGGCDGVESRGVEEEGPSGVSPHQTRTCPPCGFTELPSARHSPRGQRRQGLRVVLGRNEHTDVQIDGGAWHA